MLHSKTVWTSIIGIVTALGAQFTGAADLHTTLMAVFAGLVSIFMRHSIAKITP